MRNDFEKAMNFRHACKLFDDTKKISKDDINFIVQKLNDVTLNHAEQSEQIKKLAQMIAKYQNAIKTVDNKANYYQKSAVSPVPDYPAGKNRR
jgi:nitroreductase